MLQEKTNILLKKSLCLCQAMKTTELFHIVTSQLSALITTRGYDNIFNMHPVKNATSIYSAYTNPFHKTLWFETCNFGLR